MIKNIIIKYYLSFFYLKYKDNNEKWAGNYSFIISTFTLYIILYTILILIKKLFGIQLIKLNSFGVSGIVISSIISYIIIYGILKLDNSFENTKKYTITNKIINYSKIFFIFFIILFFFTLLI